VLTPVATTLHAQRRQEEEKNLFIHGGKYCFALALFFLLSFLLLGRSFIQLWVGPSLSGFTHNLLLPTSLGGDLTVLSQSSVGMAEFAGRFRLVPNSARVLVILALGELLPMSQWITNSILLGKDRHRLLAWASVVENGLAIALALILAPRLGLLGVCLGVAIPGILCRGLLQMLYGCWLLGLSPLVYVVRVMLPPLAAAAIPGICTYWAVFYHLPRNWLELVAYAAAFSFAYLVFALSVLGTGGKRVPSVEGYRYFHLALPPE
jgi:O-antigen/teichoic acid export membrane protein